MTEYESLSLTYMWWQNAIAIGGFLLTIISILSVYFDYRHRKNKEVAEKAIDMAKYFMEEILTGLTILEIQYKKEGIDGLIKKYKFFEFEDFDLEELKSLFSNQEIQEISKKINDTKITLKNSNGESLEVSIISFASDLLNKLEYMCMSITSGVADDSYIYDSLHQTFLSTVQLLYVHIAERNINEKDKFYRNVIKVYNKWKNKYLKEQSKEERINNRIEKNKKKIKKKMGSNKKIN